MEGLPGHPLRRPGPGAGRRPEPGRALTSPTTGRRLVLLRHGRTADNAGGRIQGQLDTPLDDLGREQAHTVAPLLAAVRPAALLSSDLSRAVGTAAPIAAQLDLPVRQDARLRELYLGSWQGLTQAQCEARHPEEFRAWRTGQDVRRGGGESYRDAGDRGAAAVLDALGGLDAGATLVAVTHGGTARGLMAVLLGQDPADWWRLGALGNCCWSLLVEHPLGWRLERHNTGPYAELTPTRPARSPDAEPVR